MHELLFNTWKYGLSGVMFSCFSKKHESVAFQVFCWQMLTGHAPKGWVQTRIGRRQESSLKNSMTGPCHSL